MAAAAHLTAGVYGYVWGQPPYVGSNSQNAFTRLEPFDNMLTMSFPTTGTIFHPVSPGQQVGNSTSNYIYSVIEVQATGLNQDSGKWGCKDTIATLATNAG